MKTITRTCLNPKCKKQFEAELREVHRGNGKYCCLQCCLNHIRPVGRTLHTLTCSYCFKEFKDDRPLVPGLPDIVVPDILPRRYCSRQCKDLNHRNDCHDARTLAFRNFPHKCNRCNWDTEPAVLEVHHKDRNRENNELSNLELLCPTDHCLDHFLAKDGKWRK
jgi:hypothetical protein